MEMEQVYKVVRLNENPIKNQEIEDGSQERGDDELSYMDKLPSELLTEILDYLGERELVKYRILSSRWNEICCLLLQEKSKRNIKLLVQIKTIHGENSLECKTGIIKKPLDEFLDCFAVSKSEKSSGRRRPFPFSWFMFADLHFMEMDQMTRLVPLLRHIKLLFLQVTNTEIKKFEVFWRLLLKFGPNVEYLELYGDHWHKMEFFEPYFNFKANCDPLEVVGDSDKSRNQDYTFLNKLKILHIELKRDHLLPKNRVIKTLFPLLENSVNLELLILEPQPGTYQRFVRMFGEFHFLAVWQRLGRAHLLKELEILNLFDGSQSHLSPPAPLMKNLQLESLSGKCDMYFNPVEKSTIMYVYHALKSSQNTLKKLDVRCVRLASMDFLFQDIKSLPNLSQLKLDFSGPSVKITENKEILDRFSQLCPNLTSLSFGVLHGDFSLVAPGFWPQFKGLKSLKLILCIKHCQINPLSVDSAISGYSQESIQKIQSKLLNQGISLEEARRGEEQQTASILDMKVLSRLELVFSMGKTGNDSVIVENQLRNSLFVKILPQHIRENPWSIFYVNYE